MNSSRLVGGVRTWYLCRRLLSSQRDLIESLQSMPRESTEHQLLKRIRLKIKEKSLKYVPGTISLQVLGSGAPGAPRSLYMFTDQSRYLFNVGEGSQRLAHEHKMKLSKLEHIFITRPTWDNIGGLPGVALTIQDVGVPQITLHGPEGTDDIFPATRRFVVLKDLTIQMASCTKESSFEDTVMRVTYVPIVATQSNESKVAPSVPVTSNGSMLIESDDVDYYDHERRCTRSPSKVPVVSEPIAPVSMAYVCTLKTRPGVLSLEACVERGVPPGPLLGRLKNGEDVTLPDGSVVLSKDVTTPDQPGPLFIVVDCPSIAYLEPLVTEPALAAHQANSPHEGQEAYAVVHFTPPAVLGSTEYQQWMAKFPEDTLHLPLNDSNVCSGSVAIHRIQHMLHLVHPQIFPLLATGVGSDLSGQVGTLNTVHLRPRHGLDASQTLRLTPDEYIHEPFNTEEFQNEMALFQERMQELACGPSTYPRIVFLGTGSCIPNKTRNTSAILIHLRADECVLLDCGEATFYQIVRLYGMEEARVVLAKLRMVYVSHLHADHHIGLVGLLKGRQQLLGPDAPPIYLLAPRQILSWLHFYHARFESILQEFRIVPNDDLSGGVGRTATPEAKQMMEDLHCRDIGTVIVRHCPNAFGVSICHEDGWKLTYSGDTMPCQDLVALGQGSDILIHEATMEDELEDEARIKLHSTTSQAVRVGQAMGAKFTLLTHFSQRYAKLPRLSATLSHNVGIAFDNMQVYMNELPILPLMHPVLKLMFSEHCDLMDAKAARRTLKNQLKRAASQSPLRGSKIHQTNT